MNFDYFNRFLLTFVISCSLLLASCKKENRCDCIKRTGEIIQETRLLSGFTQILTKENVNVFLIHDSISKVIVEAGENIAPLITTEVVGNTLVCRNKNRCNWTRSYKKPINIYVHLPQLTQINLEGTGDIKSLNTFNIKDIYISAKNSGNVELSLNAGEIKTSMHGSANLTLRGTCNGHECSVLGTAYLYAGDLHTKYTYVHSETLGLCYVNVRDLFTCKIDLLGDIFCYGSPKKYEYSYSNSGRLYIQ